MLGIAIRCGMEAEVPDGLEELLILKVLLESNAHPRLTTPYDDCSVFWMTPHSHRDTAAGSKVPNRLQHGFGKSLLGHS